MVRIRLGLKRFVAVLVAASVALNAVAYRQAGAFVRFGPPGERKRFEKWSLAEMATAVATGARIPRPENRRTPRDVGLSFERHVFAGGRGIPLEAWYVPVVARPRATIVLFHGHAAAKDELLAEARAFHDMGLAVFLVDFHGSGGSGGDETSIGFYEALDVSKAFEYARGLPDSRPVILYGVSMGAAAVLKAVGDDGIDPTALILECPFDSLLGTVRHRFTSRGIPSFPLADLLVFWGGVRASFDALAFRPVESAARVGQPTLLMNGERDPFVRPEEARAIFAALRGPKTLDLFEGVGHDAILRRRPAEWRATVATFLASTLGGHDGPLRRP